MIEADVEALRRLFSVDFKGLDMGDVKILTFWELILLTVLLLFEFTAGGCFLLNKYSKRVHHGDVPQFVIKLRIFVQFEKQLLKAAFLIIQGTMCIRLIYVRLMFHVDDLACLLYFWVGLFFTCLNAFAYSRFRNSLHQMKWTANKYRRLFSSNLSEGRECEKGRKTKILDKAIDLLKLNRVDGPEGTKYILGRRSWLNFCLEENKRLEDGQVRVDEEEEDSQKSEELLNSANRFLKLWMKLTGGMAKNNKRDTAGDALLESESKITIVDENKNKKGKNKGRKDNNRQEKNKDRKDNNRQEKKKIKNSPEEA